MTIIAATMRVATDPRTQERRDMIDQAWGSFLARCGLTPLYLPNHPAHALDLVKAIQVGGVLLTGGNSLAVYGGDAPERDQTEAALIDWARANGTPILGVCRGMQMLAHHFGGSLAPVEQHVGRHAIHLPDDVRQVNSYHDWAVHTLPPDFLCDARAPDGVAEAFSHPSQRIKGIMWHPEREPHPAPQDLSLFQTFFG